MPVVARENWRGAEGQQRKAEEQLEGFHRMGQVGKDPWGHPHTLSGQPAQGLVTAQGSSAWCPAGISWASVPAHPSLLSTKRTCLGFFVCFVVLFVFSLPGFFSSVCLWIIPSDIEIHPGLFLIYSSFPRHIAGFLISCTTPITTL